MPRGCSVFLALLALAPPAPLRADVAPPVGPRVTLEATGIPLGEALLRVGHALNRRLMPAWQEDPRLKRNVEVHLHDATTRDALTWCETALGLRLQRADRWSYYVQPGRAEPVTPLVRLTTGAWLADLARISYDYQATLVPGSGQPAEVSQAMAVQWQLVPPDDASRLSLVDATVLSARLSDGSTSPGSPPVAVAVSSGAVALSFPLPLPGQEGLRLAQTGLRLTFGELRELVFTVNLGATNEQPASQTIGGVELAVAKRGERSVRLTARRPEPAANPDPPSSPGNCARALRDAYLNAPAEARLWRADGTPLFTTTEIAYQGLANGKATWTLRAQPSGPDAEQSPARLEVHWYERGTTRQTVDLQAEDLPLPPTGRAG